MTNGSKTPDLYELIRTWVFQHLGVPGLVLLAFAFAAFYVWRNWDKVRKWPGVAHFIAWKNRWPILNADPHRFSVLVAHLENDVNREQESLIVEALKEVEGIKVLALDRTIPLAGPVPEDMEKHGHKKARAYLQQSGAAVLIWGKVLRSGGSAVPKLYWTPAHREGKAQRYAAPLLEAQLQLPEVFWSDLADILRLLVTTQYAGFRAQEGHFVSDRLPPFIARVRHLLQASASLPAWDSEARTAILVILANALWVLGDQNGRSDPLKEAVATFRQALDERTRERVPMDWAKTQNNLGVALLSLGNRESGTQCLEEALHAFRQALQELTRERVPLDWAKTQNNLGLTFAILGERESGTQRLKEAVAAFRQVLEEWTMERVPLDWAKTQNNLGNALSALGERERGTQHLNEAVDVIRQALQEWTRERVPLQWAGTQNNLGIALTRLGKQESGTQRLEEAVTAFRQALQERTRERVPLDWAAIQNNLGSALAILGERERGTQCLEEAVAAFRQALEVRTQEWVPLDWALTQNNLGNAFMRLGERERGTKRLEEAVAAYQAALVVFEREQVTYYAEMAKANLRRAAAMLQELRN